MNKLINIKTVKRYVVMNTNSGSVQVVYAQNQKQANRKALSVFISQGGINASSLR